MIKLLTLKAISPYAEDTVYKICLSLDSYGLSEDRGYESYEELTAAAAEYLEKGEHIILAAEASDYNQLKDSFLSQMMIEKNEGVTHSTADGLYEGFSAKAFSGMFTLMPLDFSRIDEILEGFTSFMSGKNETEEFAPQGAPDFDFSKNVKRMVDALSENEQRVALVTGEATMWIYNLYNEIPSLTKTASFVDVLEESFEAENDDVNAQSESVKLVGKARDAMLNAGCNFGAAISEIYSSENAEGETLYFTYVAVVDKGVAKAKKLSTTNSDDLDLLLPNAVILLCDTVAQRTEILSSDNESEEPQNTNPEKKKLPKNMVIFAAVILAIAIIIPVAVLINLMGEDTPTTTLPLLGTQPTISQTAPTAPSTTDPFAASSTTVPTQQGVTQSTAVDISAPETTAPVIPSTRGLFTFYVFGYGHGVGMSQVGANYLAQQGWTAAEILAHYYYEPNAKIVTGEKYPEKITYNGSLYDTREYLASALESEMGSSFSYEALKAQAIALYTFAKYNNYNLSQDAHAYGKTPSELCYRVVDDVMKTGYYIAYGNDVAVTPFHAMSAGVTTSYYNVWGKGIGTTVPYLAGGRKSYGDYLDSNYKSVYTISSEDMKAIAKDKLNVDLTGDPANWLTIVTHDKAVREDIGYVSSINVGGSIITGYEFRIKVLEGKIRSHCFTIVYTPQA